MATLEIGSSASYCSACKNGATLGEAGHFTRIGYGKHDGIGCGELWDQVYFSTVYGGNDYMEELAKSMKEQYPNLAKLKWV